MFGLIRIDAFFHAVTLMGFLQGVILSVLLWRRRQEAGVFFLVLHLCAVSAVMALPLLEENFGLKYSWPLHCVVCFLFQGLYLYVRHFQKPIGRLDWLLHFIIPATVLAPAAWLVYGHVSHASNAEIENSLSVTLLSCTKIIINLAYAGATLRILQRHRRLSLNVYSETSLVSLQWVERLIFGFFGIVLAGGLLYGVARLSNWPMPFADLLTYTGLVGYLYYAYVHATQQRPIITLAAQPELAESVETTEKVKYQRSSLTAEQAKTIYEKLQALVLEKQLFRDPELTLPMLAEAVGAPTYHISQVLTELAGQNFYDFINNYRVEASKQLLIDPAKKHYTVLAVAFESGFNSKTTFNKVFRKVTGLTPTEYVNQTHRT